MKKIEAPDFSTALLGLIKGSPLFFQFESAINKVIEGYRISKIDGVNQSQFPADLNNDGQWLEPILKAIISQQLLKVEYQSFGSEKKEHLLSPYILKEYRNRRYVAGHIKKADKVLVLALDRIKSLEESTEKYHSNPDFQPSEYFKYSLGITRSMMPSQGSCIVIYSRPGAVCAYTTASSFAGIGFLYAKRSQDKAETLY